LERFLSLATLEKFAIYERLLRQWNKRTALVQQDTLAHFYERHVLDSLQLVPIMDYFFCGSSEKTQPRVYDSELSDSINPLPTANLSPLNPTIQWDEISHFKSNFSLLDIGSGAGFPGMILAISGFKKVALCESNQRKCIFLEEVARETASPITILNCRAEELKGDFDIIVSRACTTLENLCKIVTHVSRETLSNCFFHKGQSWKEEIVKAQKKWSFEFKIFQSLTFRDSVIISLSQLHSKQTT